MILNNWLIIRSEIICRPTEIRAEAKAGMDNLPEGSDFNPGMP